jgi:hypothetical protein
MVCISIVLNFSFSLSIFLHFLISSSHTTKYYENSVPETTTVLTLRYMKIVLICPPELYHVSSPKQLDGFRRNLVFGLQDELYFGLCRSLTTNTLCEAQNVLQISITVKEDI